MTKTVVVGLDGASWRLIEPWMDDGTLPNLAAMREGGSWAETESCLPPVTFPNWKCYSTGKNPGKLGVFWFEHVDLAAGDIAVANGGDFDSPELWDYLNDEGQRAGVVNMPTMYPPRSIDGPVVCGGPDAVEGEYRSIESGYTSPAGLEAELEERFDYCVHPEPLLSANDERGAEVDAILELLDLRFDVALALLEERDLDLVHVTLFYLNVLQHFFWNDVPTRRAWELIDERLGEIDGMDAVNLVVMSDHGCAPTTTEFYVNEWLAENGYQEREGSVDGLLQRVGLDRENALAVAKRFGLVDTLARVVPERIQQLVPQRDGLKRGRKLEAIDLDNTKAVASGQGPIYLNPDFDVEDVRASLRADLEAAADEDGPLFDRVLDARDVYSGSHVADGPDVLLDQRDGVHVNDGVGGGTVRSGPDRWAAENTLNGIFLARGPDFRERGELDKVSILDITPTLLAAHGCAIPTDVDGEPIDVLARDGEPGEREPLTLATADREEAGEDVQQRLEELGYME